MSTERRENIKEVDARAAFLYPNLTKGFYLLFFLLVFMTKDNKTTVLVDRAMFRLHRPHTSFK